MTPGPPPQLWCENRWRLSRLDLGKELKAHSELKKEWVKLDWRGRIVSHDSFAGSRDQPHPGFSGLREGDALEVLSLAIVCPGY